MGAGNQTQFFARAAELLNADIFLQPHVLFLKLICYEGVLVYVTKHQVSVFLSSIEMIIELAPTTPLKLLGIKSTDSGEQIKDDHKTGVPIIPAPARR